MILKDKIDHEGEKGDEEENESSGGKRRAVDTKRRQSSKDGLVCTPKIPFQIFY